MSSIKDKVVLITGASSGIGAGTATHFASLGYRLALNGRNEKNLKAVADQCVALGAPQQNVLTIIAALDEVADCERVINDTIKHFGRLDVLVNNAGILVFGGIEDISVEDFDKQMNVNVRSVFVLTKLAIPHLLKVKGSIVNVSSIAGKRSFSGAVSYCMSKSALDQFTRCVALELAGRGVRVNAINPGLVQTDIHSRGGMSEEDYIKYLEKAKANHALGRVGTVEEMAKTIAFLASEDSSFITGETISVDGGRHVMCPR